MSETLRILLVDYYVLFRQGIRFGIASRPDMEVVGEAGNGLEAIALGAGDDARRDPTDISTPRLSGLEATRQIQRLDAPHPDRFSTVRTTSSTCSRCSRPGRTGYLLKNLTAGDLFQDPDCRPWGGYPVQRRRQAKSEAELAGHVRPGSAGSSWPTTTALVELEVLRAIGQRADQQRDCRTARDSRGHCQEPPQEHPRQAAVE